MIEPSVSISAGAADSARNGWRVSSRTCRSQPEQMARSSLPQQTHSTGTASAMTSAAASDSRSAALSHHCGCSLRCLEQPGSWGSRSGSLGCLRAGRGRRVSTRQACRGCQPGGRSPVPDVDNPAALVNTVSRGKRDPWALSAVVTSHFRAAGRCRPRTARKSLQVRCRR